MNSAGRLNKDGKGIDASPVSAAQLGAILDLIGEGVISGKIAKDLFEIVWSEGGDPRAIVDARGMKQVTDLGAIEKVVDEIIAANPDKAAQVKEKPAALGWFVGQVMKSSGGKGQSAGRERPSEEETRSLTRDQYRRTICVRDVPRRSRDDRRLRRFAAALGLGNYRQI